MTNPLVEAFTLVRNVPYATDGATAGAQLMVVGRGNCVAKAEFLMTAFLALGVQTRRVRWLYRLPAQPPEVVLLPSPFDVHTALEVCRGDRWVLVDATHDPALAAAGLTVVSWDGENSTPPAYPPAGPLWRAGDDTPEPHLPAFPSESDGRQYRTAYNQWLNTVRQSAPDAW
jgi:hypothetical protein